MRICSNCGTTNVDDGRICRKCGALLPVSSRPPRIRMAGGTPEIDESDPTIISSEPTSSGVTSSGVELSAAPTSKPITSSGGGSLFSTHAGAQKKAYEKAQKQEATREQNLRIIPLDPNEAVIKTPASMPQSTPIVQPLPLRDRGDVLKEITPQPYSGSIITNKGVYGPPRTESKPELSKIPAANNLSAIPGTTAPAGLPGSAIHASTESPKTDDAHYEKRKRLEEDMSDVVSVLSKKLKLPEKPKPQESTIPTKTPEVKLPPNSMNEILKQLSTIDMRIEASALIKTDGTILASAISSRISDSLFATIGQNLSMIGNDIVESLESGVLQSISIRGSEGVLDLAPIDRKHPSIKDMILLVFSHPKVKSGVINIAAQLVKVQIKEYLGIKDS